MYCELFQLTEPPFRLTPDPQFLFASKQHARAKAYMESTIWLADGFVVITGDIGSGKTTLIESFLAELPDDIVLAHISQTQLSPVEFLQALLVEFGFKPFRKRKVELLSMIKDFMVEQYAAGKKILLVIDEAQNLSRKVLEEVRLLSGLELQKEKLLRIIIAGQPELSHKLDSPRLQQLTQRVRLRFHLGALSKRETHEYITHRLDIAGRASGRSSSLPLATSCSAMRAACRGSSTFSATRRAVRVRRRTNRRRRGAHQSRRRGAAVGRVLRAAREHNRGDDATGRFAASNRPIARLEVLYRDQLVGEYQIGPGKTIIGRTADNDVTIQSRFISRHHAQVVSDQARSVLEDLNSTNGVFIRSQRVKQQELVGRRHHPDRRAQADLSRHARQARACSSLPTTMRTTRTTRTGRARRSDDDDDDDDDEDEDEDEDEEEEELSERGR